MIARDSRFRSSFFIPSTSRSSCIVGARITQTVTMMMMMMMMMMIRRTQ